ncbi:hypothetical protein D3C71_2238920 [compost metagenome]
MLEYHGQARPQHTQLFFIGDFQLAIGITNQIDILVVHRDGAFARFFEEVNTAQEGTLAGAG